MASRGTLGSKRGWTSAVALGSSKRVCISASSPAVIWSWSILTDVLNYFLLVAIANIVICLRASRGSSLLNFLLWAPDCCVDLVSNLIHSLSAVEFGLNDFIGLQEALKLAWEFVVLCSDKAHMLVQGVDLSLFRVWFINLPLVLVLQTSELVLESRKLAWSSL